MTDKDGNDQPSICLWCGKPTNAQNSNREHIFAKTIFGQTTLRIGSVCKNCNDKFGAKMYGSGNEKYSLDEALKKEHPAFMRSYQADPRLGRHDRERKQREKTEITGVGECKDMRIIRKNNDEYDVNVSWVITSETFVRALHKCTVNVLCDQYGVRITRDSFEQLLNFVYNGGDVHPWAYAVTFSKPGVIKYDPTPLVFHFDDERKKVVCFLHTSGIWITGSQPYLINTAIVEFLCETILSKISEDNLLEPEKAVDFFSFGWGFKSIPIGKLKFHWIVKEIEGHPNDSFLHLLTICTVCGQTNTTGIHLSRKIIRKKLDAISIYPRNSWNTYTNEELRSMGLDKEKWSKLTMGILVDKDVKELNITNSKTNCINCGNPITFNAKDCFV